MFSFNVPTGIHSFSLLLQASDGGCMATVFKNNVSKHLNLTQRMVKCKN